jgi:integrase
MKGRIAAAIDLGPRRGEMLKLRNRDVDWRARPDPMLTIRWGNAKSRKERQVPLTSARVVRFLKVARPTIAKTPNFIGGPPGDRTRDTVIKSHVLYH